MSRKDNRFFNQFAILTACFFAVMAFMTIRTIIGSMGVEMNDVPPKPLPAMEYVNENSQKIPLSDYKGKVILLHFWASWCTPCVYEMPRLLSFYEGLKDEHLVFVPLSLDRDMSKVVNFNEQHQVKMPLWQDAGGKAMSALGVSGIPSSFVVDHEGNVVMAMEGPVDWTSHELRSKVWNLVNKSKR